MTVRAKMRLTELTEHAWGYKVLKFAAEYDDTIPEDQRFQKATPTASAEFQIDNPAAADQFKVGDYYYLDFLPVPKADDEAPAS